MAALECVDVCVEMCGSASRLDGGFALAPDNDPACPGRRPTLPFQPCALVPHRADVRACSRRRRTATHLQAF
eukprot:365057-Chlamydomonas_euryale.AAC.3